MGWLFGWRSKQALIDELVTDQPDTVTVAHSLRGNVLWRIVECQSTQFIVCTLLEQEPAGPSNSLDQRVRKWGYKSIEEAHHPLYFDCPLGFLKRQPRVDCEKWRMAVRRHYKQQRLKLSLGDIVQLHDLGIPKARVVQLRPRLVGKYAGNFYWIQRQHIVGVNDRSLDSDL